MNTKFKKSILAGIIGTVLMTAVMMIAPMMGMPKMSPPEMLSGMLNMPIFVGWIMHFMTGIIFAFSYTYLFSCKLPGNLYIKGLLFGVIIFIIAQIMMAVMKSMMPMHSMKGPMMMTMIGSLMGHIIFGIAVSKTIGNSYCSNKTTK